MLPATATESIRRAGGVLEEVRFTEPTWEAMEPLLGRIAEQAARLLNYVTQGGAQFDVALLVNLLATTMPKDIVLAATGKDAAWLKTVFVGDMPKLIAAAVGVTVHPDLFPGLKKIGEVLRGKISTPETSATPSPTSPPTASATT